MFAIEVNFIGGIKNYSKKLFILRSFCWFNLPKNRVNLIKIKFVTSNHY